jgi:hypothetical protein
MGTGVVVTATGEANAGSTIWKMGKGMAMGAAPGCAIALSLFSHPRGASLTATSTPASAHQWVIEAASVLESVVTLVEFITYAQTRG